MSRNSTGLVVNSKYSQVLIDFCSFFLGPHLLPNNSNQWDEKLASGKMKELMSVAIRKPESGIKKKNGRNGKFR